MRTFVTLFATSVTLLAAAGVASARDLDMSSDGSTSLSAAPRRDGGSRVEKEPTVAAKYEVAFPVRDRAPLRRDHDSI